MDCLVHRQQPAKESKHDVLSSQIIGGDSVILIDSAKRNFDEYVQPLCRRVREKGNQFITILLVASRKRLLELHHQVSLELDNREFATCCTTNQQASEMLARGHGLLLTTTKQLSAMQSDKLFRSAPIGCLVFDELERLLAYGGSCFQALKFMLYKHYPSMQIVVTTRLWLAEEMEQLLRHAKQPLLLFKDLLEAAAYGGCSWQVQMGNRFEEQLQQLLAYLQTHSPQQHRTLIYCALHEDFLELKNQLSSYEVLLHRGRQDKQRIERWQRKHAGQILLLQAHAPELQVDNAQSVVHFNMPPTWSQFRKRFAVFKGEIRNALMPSESDQQLRSLVLLDRQSQQSLPQLLEFMQQHGQPIDEQLAKSYSQLVTTREESLMARQAVLCPVMLLYGSCRILPTCQYRHLLSDIDRNCATVPSGSLIRFQLLKICTPSHFAARLVSQRATTKCQWQSLSMPQRYAELQQQLRSHFATTEHRVAVRDVQLQQICVRRMTDNSFERVCITFASNTSALDTTVRVKHLDLSTVIHHVKLSELFICPLELQQVQPLALDVRLSGVVPYNGEEIWQSSDNVLISDLLHPGGIYDVHVDYALSQTIFVSCLQLNAQDYAEQLQIRHLGLLDESVKKRLSELIHDKEG